MKMKVIDLINMHARNEEMPKQIKVGDCNEVLTYDGYNYTLDGTPLDGFLDFFDCLNDEVEIIGEEKKIEPISICVSGIMGFDGVENIMCEFKDKINEIIDALNKLKVDDKD